jgi:adenine-specific DNA-methyltransferase
LVALIAKQRANRILLSYSDEGHVPLEPLAEALCKLGNLSVIPLKSIGRYRPNQVAAGVTGAVTEFILVLERAAKHRKKTAVA